MSIRITTIPVCGTTVIKIDGRLLLDDTEELVRTFRDVEGPAALDLTELQSVDRTCAELLRDSIAAGMELRAASPYVELLLKKGNTR
ncbi:MAG: hypothetical protein KJ000_08405 [Pirellulaceae bacterium]|nr:hypothetical protein [Pirellulaceae bacterium]